MIIVPSATGTTARLLASLRLPVPVVAISPNPSTCQHLQFSYGVTAVHSQDRPVSWTSFVKEWMSRHGLQGQFAILVERVPFDDPAGEHRLEIIRIEGP
jgi:pyruvate kinase